MFIIFLHFGLLICFFLHPLLFLLFLYLCFYPLLLLCPAFPKAVLDFAVKQAFSTSILISRIPALRMTFLLKMISFPCSVADAISAAIPSVASPNTHPSSQSVSSSIPIAMPSRLFSSIPSFKNCRNKRCGATGRKPYSHTICMYPAICSRRESNSFHSCLEEGFGMPA